MKKTAYVLTITLNPAIDKTIVIPHFRRGAIYRPEEIGLTAGGKGINVSRVLAPMGINTFASGFLPRKGADFVEYELSSRNIKYRFIKVEGDIRTNLTILNPTSKKATRIFEPGGTVRNKDIVQFKKEYAKLLKKASMVVISGSNANGIPDNFCAQLVTLAKREKIPAILDTSLEPFKLGIKRKPFMIKPNLQEAEGLLGRKLKSNTQIKKALKELCNQGAHTVALTDGKEGAYVYNGEEMFHAIPPRIEQKNPVGCGDSFVAGFISAYLTDHSFADCVRFGSACGCANAMSINPGEVSLMKVVSIIKKIKLLKM